MRTFPFYGWLICSIARRVFRVNIERRIVIWKFIVSIESARFSTNLNNFLNFFLDWVFSSSIILILSIQLFIVLITVKTKLVVSFLSIVTLVLHHLLILFLCHILSIILTTSHHLLILLLLFIKLLLISLLLFWAQVIQIYWHSISIDRNHLHLLLLHQDLLHLLFSNLARIDTHLL